MKRTKQCFKKVLKTLNSSHGVTMVEIMMTVAIFALMSSGIYSTMLAGDRSFQVGRIRMELQQELRKAMEHITLELRESASGALIGLPADGNTYTSVEFVLPTGVTAGATIWDTNNIRYDLGGFNGDQLQRTYNGTTKILAQNINTLNFSRLAADPDIVDVSLTASDTTTAGSVITSGMDFSIQLRN